MILFYIEKLLNKPPKQNLAYDKLNPDPSSWAPLNYLILAILNLLLMTYISELEYCLGKNAVKEFLPMQEGDVPATEADTQLLEDYKF